MRAREAPTSRRRACLLLASRPTSTARESLRKLINRPVAPRACGAGMSFDTAFVGQDKRVGLMFMHLGYVMCSDR
jgi:hypothetical protein